MRLATVGFLLIFEALYNVIVPRRQQIFNKYLLGQSLKEQKKGSNKLKDLFSWRPICLRVELTGSIENAGWTADPGLNPFIRSLSQISLHIKTFSLIRRYKQSLQHFGKGGDGDTPYFSVFSVSLNFELVAFHYMHPFYPLLMLKVVLCIIPTHIAKPIC